ncbi:hypothetical protein J4475_02450 [Candidatus Woesearchaeota archaeon]|nr:hypothetical protein [Candidatus Woesearchaeota archaeon]
MADTAVKVSVKKIETDSSLNKINIMGTVVNQARREEGNAIVVDDGSSVIDVLIFDNTVNNAQVGDLVQVIGNVGTIEGKKVIAGQIVKRLDNRRWLELRRMFPPGMYHRKAAGLLKKQNRMILEALPRQFLD